MIATILSALWLALRWIFMSPLLGWPIILALLTNIFVLSTDPVRGWIRSLSTSVGLYDLSTYIYWLLNLVFVGAAWLLYKNWRRFRIMVDKIAARRKYEYYEPEPDKPKLPPQGPRPSRPPSAKRESELPDPKRPADTQPQSSRLGKPEQTDGHFPHHSESLSPAESDKLESPPNPLLDDSLKQPPNPLISDTPKQPPNPLISPEE